MKMKHDEHIESMVADIAIDRNMSRRTFEKLAILSGLTFLNGCLHRVMEIEYQDRPEENGELEESPEIREKIEEFKKEIELYKSIGFEVKIQPGMVSKYMGIGHGEDILEMSKGKGREIEVSMLQDPLEHLKFIHGIDKQIDPDLRGNNTIGLYMLHEEIEETDPKGHEGISRLYNWLKERPLLLEQRVQKWDDNPQPLIRAYNVVQSELEDISKYQKIIDAIKPNPEIRTKWKPTYEVMRDAELSLDQKQRTEDLVRKFQVDIAAVPEGGEIDEVVGDSYFIKAITLTYNQEKFQKTQKPIRVNGQVNSIRFIGKHQFGISKVNEAEGTVDGQKAGRSYYDQDGNFIVQGLIPLIKGGEKTALHFMEIYPKIEFSRDRDDPREISPIHLRLHGINLKDVEGLLHQKVEKPIVLLGDKKEYGIYSNMDHEKVQEEFGARFGNFERGIADVEDLFGVQRGKAVENVYIVNSQMKNARVAAKDPTTVVLFDEMLRHETEPEDDEATARHEAMHIIDFQLNIGGDEEFKKFFATVQNNTDFLDQLNEKNFLPHMTIGGHSREGESEFLSSFINTFRHPNWEETVEKKSSEFQETYRYAIEEVQKILEKNKKISNKASIFSLLSEKRMILERIKSEREKDK